MYRTNVVTSDRGGIDQEWLEPFKHSSHKWQSGKKGEEDGSSETDCDEDDATSLSANQSYGAPAIVTNILPVTSPSDRT